MKKTLLASLLCLFLFSTGFCQDNQKPNVVLIFVDDLGYGDLGCYGNTKIKTPNIDRLSAEGQRFTNFYSSGSSCVPSRTGLMSGRHPAMLGREKLADDPKSLLPVMFNRQGYATAILGKWHLAGYPNDFTHHPMHPLECGFDYHFGTPGSNDVPPPIGKKQTRDVFDAADKLTFQVPLIRGREIVEMPVNQELLTRRYTEEAVKWIREKKDQRFFLYLAHNMPHAPIFASPDFQNRSDGGRYGDVVEELDWSVGEVMKAIHDAAIDEHTLIIFTSDNGPWTAFGPHGGTAKPLRGEKATAWEGGFRVPAIFRWTGKIVPGNNHAMAANLDLYATFAALTNAAEPKEKPGYISRDLSRNLLYGEAGQRNQWYYGPAAFRSGKYKIHLLTQFPTNTATRRGTPPVRHDPPLLFDLDVDIGEQNNLASERPEVVARLLREMQAFVSN